MDTSLGKNKSKKEDLIPINGCYLPPAFRLYEDEVSNFEVFDSDIWVCTFARSGTTWSSEMVWAIMNDCDPEKAKSCMFDRIRFLDMVFLFEANKKFKEDSLEAIVDSINYAKNQSHPRIIKTHLPLQLLPKQIQSGERRPKIVYVCRNPMDVCVSYYHFIPSMAFKADNGTESQLTMSDFCDLFIAGKVLYGPFWEHILPFWHMKDQPNILFIKYEDMKADLSAVINKTAHFLEKTLSETQIENLKQHLSFESMKKNPSINQEKVMKAIKSTSVYSPFIRSGLVGGYKNEMPESRIKSFQKWMEDKLAGTGLRF